MSRIGKLPITIPAGVKVSIFADKIEFIGPKGTLTSPLFPEIKVEQEGNLLVFTRSSDAGPHRAFHGLCRALAFNASTGVSTGFIKKMQIVGVGYRAKIEKDYLELNLGYSKPVVYKIPEDIEIEVEKPTLFTIKGIDKQRVGQEAHKIRSFRKPDPYKLKGIRYVGEELLKKERKAGVSDA
ncbi:MAG: 50S ribosomal protein L6 [Candidatus Aminicenantes bacterium]|nr:50S ribosomal protein L6 [Candidatus Aminicenantes bacterium]